MEMSDREAEKGGLPGALLTKIKAIGWWGVVALWFGLGVGLLYVIPWLSLKVYPLITPIAGLFLF
jgi:hypothetical protein